MAHLFEPLTLRGVTLRNRIGMSPMCTYSAPDGKAGPWHLIHLGSRATGGAGLLVMEATAVRPEGRISPADLGLWSETQVEALVPLTACLLELGAVPGLQIAHAGRKAGTKPPWEGRALVSPAEGGWIPVAPSPVPFREGYPVPEGLSREGIAGLREDFQSAAARAARAGFSFLEIHMAHGYLLHEFLSPLCNRRDDEYGGTLTGRMRFPLEVTEAVRAVWPPDLPLSVRISVTDWVNGGWDHAARRDSHRLT